MQLVPDGPLEPAARWLSQHLGRRVGGSTGTNMVAMLRLADAMRQRGETGSLLTLLCDAGERYLPTYYQADWVAENFGDCTGEQRGLQPLMHGA